MWFGRDREGGFTKKNSEKAKHPQIGPSFGGNVGKIYFRHRSNIPSPPPEI